MAASKKDQVWVASKDAEIESVPNVPGVSKQMLAYADSCMCVHNYFEKGAVGPLHSHPHTQITFIVEGSFEFTVGDEKRVVTKGDTILKQDGVVHGCVCLESGSLIDFFTPMREDFV